MNFCFVPCPKLGAPPFSRFDVNLLNLREEIFFLFRLESLKTFG